MENKMAIRIAIVISILTTSVFSLAISNAYAYAYTYTNKVSDAVLAGQMSLASLVFFILGIGFAVIGITTSRKK